MLVLTADLSQQIALINIKITCRSTNADELLVRDNVCYFIRNNRIRIRVNRQVLMQRRIQSSGALHFTHSQTWLIEHYRNHIYKYNTLVKQDRSAAIS